MVNFFFQRNKVFGNFFTVLRDYGRAAAEVAQCVAKRNMEVEGQRGRAVAIILRQIVFKTFRSIVWRKYRRCRVAGIAGTRPVKLLEDRKEDSRSLLFTTGITLEHGKKGPEF